MAGNRGSGYQPADAAGHFVAQPQVPVGSPEVFDFDELETDPRERRPGGTLAKRLWSAPLEVRQWKWVSVGLACVVAFLLQSLSLYFATRRYVRWVGALGDKTGDNHAGTHVDEGGQPIDVLAMRMLQPRDTVSEMMNVSDGVSKLPFDILLSLLPLCWLVSVIHARNLRLWTQTLLAATFLALLRGLLSSLTLLPDPLGWQGCEANLRPEVMAHYQGQPGFADIAKALGLILLLWVQDLVLGMRLQERFVCAGGASMSGSVWFSALFALAVYDLSRMWTRKMKPHFRGLCHLASAAFLTALVLVDAGIDVALGRQYTAGVTMALVLALLTYQSPALAVCADRLLIRGTPPLHALTVPAGGQNPPREGATAPREENSRDLGDVVVPPCCLPFCGFHGRYYLYSQPASEKEQELLAQRQAQAELEQLQKEQELTTRRLLELEAQLEALHARQAQRAAEDPKIFEAQLQARLDQARQAFEQQAAKVQADTERVQEEKLRLQERFEAEARKEELLSGVVRFTEVRAGDFRVLPQSAWSQIYERFGVPERKAEELLQVVTPIAAPALPVVAASPPDVAQDEAAAVAAVKPPAAEVELAVAPKALSLPPHLRPSATPALCFRRSAMLQRRATPQRQNEGDADAAVEEPASASPLAAAGAEEPSRLPKSWTLLPQLRPSATPSLCFRRHKLGHKRKS